MKTRSSLWLSILSLPLFVHLAATPSAATAQDVPVIGQDIAYASGGIGTNERDEMQAMLADYSLKLAFAVEGSGAYLSDVSVTLQRGSETVFQVTDVGPWLLVKLPAGSYRVIALSGDQTTEATIEVPEGGLASAVLRFPES